MQKLLLISILVMTFVIPAFTARDPSPRRALRRTLSWMMAGLFFYVIAVILLYARLG